MSRGRRSSFRSMGEIHFDRNNHTGQGCDGIFDDIPIALSRIHDSILPD